MFDLLLEEIDRSPQGCVYVALKKRNGVIVYYLTKKIPTSSEFGDLLDGVLREMMMVAGIDEDNPIAWVKLRKNERTENAVFLHAYFSDVGEKHTLLFRDEFPELGGKNNV